jgi:hypothetical protein
LLTITALAMLATHATAKISTETWQNEWTILINYDEGDPPPPKHHGLGWIAGEVGTEFLNFPHQEENRTGLLALHPASEEEAAKIRFNGRPFLDESVLAIEASGNVAGDCVLQCVVNGKPIGQAVLDGTKWTTTEFDLSEFAGEPLELELWVVPGGENPWAWEHCYIDNIYFKGSASEGSMIITDGLILDLNADKGVSVVENDLVTNWKNQVADFPAQDFAQYDGGREIPGSGRPSLKKNVAELRGHNSLVFQEDELINTNRDAFDHLITGGGYTWIFVMSAYAQVGKLQDVSVFFGNLHCGPGKECEGFWAGFEDDNDLWTGPRNGVTFGRYNADNPKLMGPRFEEYKYYVVAGRLAEGTGTVMTAVFVDSPVPYEAVAFPVNPDANASLLAIGTERDAWQHPGQESFHGEIARALFYERPLSDAEMAQMMTKLKEIYLSDN